MDHPRLLSNVLSAQLSVVERQPVDPSVRSELVNSIKGTVYSRGDQSFELHSKIFNGDVVIRASLLVRPFDTKDVSQVVKFCTRHALSLSPKAAGYGTHGQAVQGDVILDLSLLNDINIEKMNSEGGFTSIKDMPSSRNAGKGREVDDFYMPEASGEPLPGPQEFLMPLTGKRRAEEAFCDEVNSSKEDFSRSSLGVSPLPTAPVPELLSVKSQRMDNHPTRVQTSHPHIPVIINSSSSAFLEQVGINRQKSSGSTSGEGNTSPSGGGSRSLYSGSGSSFPSGNRSIITNATHVHSRTSKSQSTPLAQGDLFGYMTSTDSASVDTPMSTSPPSQSDPFGYLSDSPAVMPAAPSLPTLDPPSIIAPSFAQPGSSVFSPAGHYMPTRVNPRFPYAFVTFGAGAKQKDIDLYSASHPLPATSLEGAPCFTPYHVPFSAHPVGASVMILGGFGFLSRLHGLSIDNLVEVEMVLADGSIVVVNQTEHPDLWWAIRGAGPALGIVTRYKAKAYPVPVVFAGNILYKFRRSTAASLIKHFRDCVKSVPRELYANVILTAGPDGQALLVIQLCYLGPQEQGVEYLQAITSWEGEQCLLNEVSEKTFLNQQDSLAQCLRGRAGRKWFIRSDLLGTLSDEMIHDTVMRFADTPVGCTWLFELSGGNVSDDHGGCFPASVRQATWTIAAFHQWELDEDDPRCVTSAEEWIKETLGPASTGGPFPSFFGIHESYQRIKGSFGDNWQRLCEVKRKYDPEGFFTHNFWPLDKDDQPKDTIVPTHTEF